MEPYNFGVGDHSGTDAAIHMSLYLTDAHPGKIILSIDGAGAYDHISRTRMFEQLMGNPDLHGLVPFARQWYGLQSQFRWRDNTGPHIQFCKVTGANKVMH